MAEPVSITIGGERARSSHTDALFQQGVIVPIPGPRSVSDFLVLDLGIDPAYIRDTVATVFVDSMVVDDLDRAMLHPGSTLTLSAAMPGLVGATLRRASFYAAMRAEVSWHEGPATPDADGPEPTIRVKLFNLIIPGVGPAILRRGIVLGRDEALGAFGPDPAIEGAERDRAILLRVAS